MNLLFIFDCVFDLFLFVCLSFPVEATWASNTQHSNQYEKSLRRVWLSWFVYWGFLPLELNVLNILDQSK